MRGLMQERPLLVSSLLTFAARHHGEGEVVTASVEGGRHRYTYADAERRARRLARVLGRLGVRAHDRVGTLAWNTHRHLELYYAVSGSGAVCHTINPRLFDEQVAYIIDHAEDRVLFADLTFLPLVERVLPRLRHRPEAVVVMTDAAHMPDGGAYLCYEDLLAEADEDYAWPELDEGTASALCYTSGTTGHPKGVLYSHRSTVLLAYGLNLPDVMGLRAADRVMPVVPMFHANAWGMVYAAPMVGAALVMPGARLDGASLATLVREEGVTMAAGVPTVWQGVLEEMRRSGEGGLGALERILIGGSACPPSMIEAFAASGVRVDHGWGMTEISPVGAYNSPKPSSARLEPEAFKEQRARQGRAFFGVDHRIVNDEGRELPHDGVAYGRLMVRGPWVCRTYYGEGERSVLDAEGWFDTGDVATIDADGYVAITDRSKDLIKSGGEWISSIVLEGIAVAHPDVLEAAVVAARHPRWDERPLLLVVPREGRSPEPADVLALFEGKVAKWWVPDAALVVPELPHTATGKLLKTAIRRRYGDHYLAAAKGDDAG